MIIRLVLNYLSLILMLCGIVLETVCLWTTAYLVDLSNSNLSIVIV